MDYFLGFDGGGTKTECVLLDAAGSVVARASAGPSNLLRVGSDAAFAALASSAAAALAGADLESSDVGGVCAGLAGAGRPRVAQQVKSFLQQNFRRALVHVTTDFEIALEAAAGAGPGVVLIAGTGSSAFGRNAVGQTARAGGYGPWVGDEGSAFDIGRRAVAAVARAREDAASSTRLAELVLPALALASWDDLIEHVAQHADDVFPLLFPVVIDAASSGDGPAHEILLEGAAALARLAETVIRRLNLQDTQFVLAKSGGVFSRTALLEGPLDHALWKIAPRAEISVLNESPAVGAARLAARLAGASSSVAEVPPKSRSRKHGAEG